MRQRMSVRSRRELLKVTYERYQKAASPRKKGILDEFVAATGYHRKYAVELLLHPPRLKPTALKRIRKRRYGPAARQALISVWKCGNCICTKRLMPFLPELLEALQRHGELSLEPYTKEQLLKMSAATADRLLKSERKSLQPHGKCTTKPGTLLKQQIPIRTFAEWNENKAGFLEIDLVAHCDDSASGEFLHSLVMTDVATGWTECQALGSKGQVSVFAGIEDGRAQFPFAVLGLDSDNGSEFINAHLNEYCKKEKITFTRCRPYRKNDQCHVEQKNWSIVRRMVGYDRYEGQEAQEALSALYQKLRQYENFFQPCMKLVSKERVSTNQGSQIIGSRVKKKYDQARTPYRRVLASEDIPDENKEKLTKEYEQLNPRALLTEIHRLQEQLWSQSKHYRAIKQG